MQTTNEKIRIGDGETFLVCDTVNTQDRDMPDCMSDKPSLGIHLEDAVGNNLGRIATVFYNKQSRVRIPGEFGYPNSGVAVILWGTCRGGGGIDVPDMTRLSDKPNVNNYDIFNYFGNQMNVFGETLAITEKKDY